MSIRNNIGYYTSVTTQPRALQHFTDRYPLIRRFAHYLHDSAPPSTILFLYGDGGNGKSLLLRYLRERCCKRVDAADWAYITALPDAAFARRLATAENAEAVPSATLDFGMQPRGEERPQEPFAALLMLRRALRGRGLQFPLYDFAGIWYMHQTGQLSRERLATLFPSEEADLVAAFADVTMNALNLTTLGIAGVAKAALGVINKHAGRAPNERLTLYLQRRKLKEADVERIVGMDPYTELIDALPTFFAEDLNTSLALPDAPKRLVLCFDTHEAFWGAQRDLSNELYFERDAWLRRLLRALDLKTGIVVVVAGRDRPRWAEATAAQEPIPNKFLDVQHIGHLADGDARVYLDRVGVPDGPLRNGLLEAARVAANEIHPYYLGLCVDIVQAAAAHGHAITADDFLLDPTITDKEQTLIDRLLKYVDRDVKDAVYALSACRSFDWIIYTTLAHALHFQATRAAFTTLLQLSFVWSAAPPGDGWYRIHDLLRRLLHDRGDPQVQKAHAILEQFYVERAKDGDDGAVVEAIYHANRQQWERGVDAWTNVFDRALQRSRLDLCRALLDLRTDLVLAPDGKRAGDVAFFLGMYYVRLSRHAEVLDAFATALSMYDGVLEHTPDAVDVLNNKGIVLQEMGEVYVHRTHYAQALSRYHQAAAVYDALEQQDPENMVILNNRGTVLQRLGDLHEERGENDRALACYRQAIDAYDAIIKHAPDDVDAYSNKSIVLRRRGNLQVKLMQHDEARDSYAQAVAACDTALRYAPNAVDVLRNKAVAQGRLAELHARNGQHRPAFHTYQSAVATADAALQHAPDDVYVLDGKGLVLKSWADTYQRVKQYQAALPVYEHAIAAFDAVLEHAPDNIYTLHNKGIALHNRANAHLELNNRAPALTDLYAARAVFDRSLMLAPHNQYIQQARHDTQQAIDSLENGGDDT